jgi:[ribosomal protein S5]-alanine N-acetyltransferase
MHESPLDPSVLLRGGTVTLRELDAGDFEAVHAYASDPESWTYVDWRANSPEKTREYLTRAVTSRHTDPRTEYTLAITTTDTAEVVGVVELRIDDPQRERGSVGYVVTRAHQGRGYATEATALIAGFGLGTLGLRRIEATCDPRNAPSVRVLAKAGFARVSLLVDHRTVRGQRGDSLLFAIDAVSSPKE